MSLISMGKDLYILEFGASANVIGSCLLVCSFAAPLMDSTVGSLQDRGGFLSKTLDPTTWGRRAPWFLTHNAMLAPLLFAFFVPPSYKPQVLHAWFSVVWLIGYWCVAACINAFESARVEIYPFKEERVILERYCKVTVGIGAAVGTGASFLCLTYPHQITFLAASVVGMLTILSSTASVEVLREARSQRPEGQKGARKNFLAAIRSKLVLRMVLLRCFQGIYETIMPTLQLYYFTFVFHLDKEIRLYWFGLGGLLMAISELALAPIWSWAFARSTKLMLYVPLSLRMLDAVLAPIILLSSQDPKVFVAYLGFWRICNSGYSYWRVAACAWVCDHENLGEGMLLGLFTMVNNLGRALTSSFAVLGLGWAGLVTYNCLEAEGLAHTECRHAQLYDQPESLRRYLQVMLAVVAPLVELVIVALTYEFPIRPGSQLLEDVCRSKSRQLSGRLPQGQQAEEEEQRAASPKVFPSMASPKVAVVGHELDEEQQGELPVDLRETTCSTASTRNQDSVSPASAQSATVVVTTPTTVGVNV